MSKSMGKEQLQELFNKFLKNYGSEQRLTTWDNQSQQFRKFWEEQILNKTDTPLEDVEIDKIVSILDSNARGNKDGKNESVATTLVPQEAWRKLFKEIKRNKELNGILTKILESEGDEQGKLLDDLWIINKEKNRLTGPTATTINAMLFAFNPGRYVSVVSLGDRERIIAYFNLPSSPDFKKDSWGKKIVMSNTAIIEGFKNLGVNHKPRIISAFIYDELKKYWKPKIIELPSSLNVILYGPPGTGKTFFARSRALRIATGDNFD